MAKKLFSDADFDKSINIGDLLVFDKPNLKHLQVVLTWAGTDLDICAFLLGEDGMIHDKRDLVFYNSQLRWKTTKYSDDDDFDPFDGEFSTWAKDSVNYKNQNKWMQDTYPISSDGSVIGSHDEMSNEEECKDCDETMYVSLEEVDTRTFSTIVFVAAVGIDQIRNGETFADAHDPVVNIYDADTGELLAEYKLAQQFSGKDVVCIGKVAYDFEKMLWNFEPMADGYQGGIMYLAREVYN